MATEDLAPTSDISVEFIPWGGGNNYDKVDEDYASPVQGTGETVYVLYADATDEYGLGNTASMGAGDETSSVEILIYVGWNVTGYRGSLDARLYIAGGYETSTEGAVEIADEVPGSWQTKTFTGVWTKAQVDAAQSEITITNNAETNEDDVGTVVVRVTYAASGGGGSSEAGIIAVGTQRLNFNRLRRI